MILYLILVIFGSASEDSINVCISLIEKVMSVDDSHIVF